MNNEYISNYQFQKKLIYLQQQIDEFERLDREHKRTKSTTWFETEEKYRHQLEQIDNYACIIQDGKVRFTTSNISKLIGFSIEELIDNLFIHYVQNDELPKLIKNYIHRLAGEDIPQIYKTILKHKDGSKVYVEVSVGIIPYHGKLADLAIVKYLTKRN